MIIAEIGINHNGDMDLAKKLIFMAKNAGAQAVKFQKRTVETVYAGQLDAPRNDGNPYGWKTVGEQKNGIEFSIDQYKEIDAFCRDHVDIPWFYSAWDMESLLQMHEQFDCYFEKIASAMLTNMEFCNQVAAYNKYTFVSTGGSSIEEIQDVVDIFSSHDTPICLMHTVSRYPCPDHELNLNMLHTLRDKFPHADIGYSGHEVGLYPSVMAMAIGAKVIERHITMDRSMYGSDQAASLEFYGLRTLCDVNNRAEAILGDGVKTISKAEAEIIKKLRYWQ